MSPLSNPALVPPGTLAPTTPPGAAGHSTGPDGATRKAASAQPARSFAEALTQAGASEPLQFSRHALARVQRRGIELDPTTLGRLSQGVDSAASKGSRDSLVLVDGTAFVVSVSNRTVITAVGSEHMKDHVFTNIDSAVIA
jgi:flagellar operon protein